MTAIGILFDPEELGGNSWKELAYEILFTSLEKRHLLGSTIYEGEIQKSMVSPRRTFAIILDLPSEALLSSVRTAIGGSQAKGLLPGPTKIVEQESLSQLHIPHTIVARINSDGVLTDCDADWVITPWEKYTSSQEEKRLDQEIQKNVSVPQEITVKEDTEEDRAELASQADPQGKSNAQRTIQKISRIPTILKIPEGVLRALAGVLGIGLGVLVSWKIHWDFPKDTMLGKMFDFDEMATTIPVTIACFFSWGVLLCFFRWLRLRGLSRSSGKVALLTTAGLLSKTTLIRFFETIGNLPYEKTPLLRRVQAITRQWLVNPSLQDADLIHQQHAAYDEENVHSGYSLIRTFIWALPVLGLIGTVIGISVAVGGFAEFLGGDIEKVAVIKQNLVGVTGGLSFAFLITLLGLLTSLLLMLAASILQTRETTFFANLQRDIADHFLPVLQKVAPEPTTQNGPADIGDWRTTLHTIATDTLEEVKKTSISVIDSLATRQTDYHEQVESWATRLHNVTNTAADTLGTALSSYVNACRGLPEELSEKLGPRVGELKEQIQGLREAIELNATTTKTQLENVKLVIELQSEALMASKESVFSLGMTTQSVLDSQTTLQNSLQTLQNGEGRKAMDGITEILEAQLGGINKNTLALEELSKYSESVLNAQITLQEAMKQLDDSKFTSTLSELRNSLAELAPILKSFREPFVFQAVPANSHPSGRNQ